MPAVYNDWINNYTGKVYNIVKLNKQLSYY